MRHFFLFLCCFALFCATSKSAPAQSTITNNPGSCAQTAFNTPTGGSYTGPNFATCDMQALCSATLIFPSWIYANVTSGLACPAHSVLNVASGGWNHVDTINANVLATDTYSGLVRGSGFSQNGCNTSPIYSYNSYIMVCSEQLPEAGGSGVPNNPDTTQCFYEGLLVEGPVCEDLD
jgi:hypothetical protein